MAGKELITLIRTSKRLSDLLISKDIDARMATWDDRQKEAVKHLMNVLGQMMLQIARELRDGKEADDRLHSLIACTSAFHRAIVHKAYPGWTGTQIEANARRALAVAVPMTKRVLHKTWSGTKTTLYYGLRYVSLAVSFHIVMAYILGPFASVRSLDANNTILHGLKAVMQSLWSLLTITDTTQGTFILAALLTAYTTGGPYVQGFVALITKCAYTLGVDTIRIGAATTMSTKLVVGVTAGSVAIGMDLAGVLGRMYDRGWALLTGQFHVPEQVVKITGFERGVHDVVTGLAEIVPMFKEGYNMPGGEWGQAFEGRDRALKEFYSVLSSENFRLVAEELAQTTGINARMAETKSKAAAVEAVNFINQHGALTTGMAVALTLVICVVFTLWKRSGDSNLLDGHLQYLSSKKFELAHINITKPEFEQLSTSIQDCLRRDLGSCDAVKSVPSAPQTKRRPQPKGRRRR